tara:strand:+ start:233 stop:589 length:357 start_codon:yes stop_codon:yes gene_type:complete
MAHFAKIESGIVTTVIVADQAFIDTQSGTWVQTSYNTYGGVHYGSDGRPDGGTALRKNYAGIGYTYDSSADAFHAPRPFASWALNTDTYQWEPPTARPNDSNRYTWNEGTRSWDAFSE